MVAIDIKAKMQENICQLEDCPKDVQALLIELIDAMPAYQQQFKIIDLLRKNLKVLSEFYLPNNKVSAEKSVSSFTVITYTGGYSGYQDAFYRNVRKTESDTNVFNSIRQANEKCTEQFWGNYAIALLTDAIRLNYGYAVKTDSLLKDLEQYHSLLQTAISAGYLSICLNDYAPTQSVFAKIKVAGLEKTCCAELKESLLHGDFTANINQAIAQGGDQAAAATWFLYNIWIDFLAMGCNEVDEIINQCIQEGMAVPDMVSAGRWWNGGYANWLIPLNGKDVSDAAEETMKETLTEEIYHFKTIRPHKKNIENGYSLSFCFWGELNRYS